MAKELNKSRVRDIKLVVIISILLILFSKQLLPSPSFSHIAFTYFGFALVIACVMGRIYCTAFLGGYKNNTLVTYGPFSLCRNPLYFFSFLGACGVTIMTGHLVLVILIPMAFYAIFQSVMKREEAFLTAHFGAEYITYVQKTPRFIPNPSLFHVPESIPMYPRYLRNGIKDSVLWFLSLPALQAIDYLHQSGIISTIFILP